MVDNSDRQQIVNMADQDYTYTESLGLALYGDQTPADFRNGHNFNMRELDKDYGEIKDLAQTGVDASKKAQEDVKNVQDQLGGLGVDSVQDAQNLLARIEKTETNTNNNTDSLTALGAETSSKAAALAKKIDDAATKQDKLLVLFGDSWCHLNSDLLAVELAKGLAAEYKNYGVDGASFAGSGAKAMSKQLETAMADSTVDKNKVTHVYVVAGINDFQNNSAEATVNSESASVFEKLGGLYPNAKLVFAPSAPAKRRSKDVSYSELYRKMIRNAQNNGFGVPVWCMWWGMMGQNPSTATNDWWTGGNNSIDTNGNNYVHPNLTGIKIFAKALISALNGGNPFAEFKKIGTGNQILSMTQAQQGWIDPSSKTYFDVYLDGVTGEYVYDQREIAILRTDYTTSSYISYATIQNGFVPDFLNPTRRTPIFILYVDKNDNSKISYKFFGVDVNRKTDSSGNEYYAFGTNASEVNRQLTDVKQFAEDSFFRAPIYRV